MENPRADGATSKAAHQRAVFLKGLDRGRCAFVPAEVFQKQASLVVQLRPERISEEHLCDLLMRSPSDAARWIMTAAEIGYPAAQVVLGQLLLDGHGVKQDKRAACAWFEKAAIAGDMEARNMLGRCFEQGWGVDPDPQRATESFEIAAQAGHVWGQVNLAQMLMRAGNPADRPRCFALFKAAAESGTSKPHLKAMNSLARFLEEGWAGSPDPAGAVFWYQRAAELGDHWGQYNLATILVSQGEHEAANQLLRSAIGNSDNGFRRRIAALLLARPECQLRQRGLEALARCAESNAPDDLYAYGLLLAEGIAGRQDLDQAALLIQAAAAQGHAQASRYLEARGRLRKVRRFAIQAFSLACRISRLAYLSSVSNRKHHGN